MLRYILKSIICKMIMISSIRLRSPITTRFSLFVVIILLTTQCRKAILNDVIFTLSKDGAGKQKSIAQDVATKTSNRSNQEPDLQTLQIKGEENTDTMGIASDAVIDSEIEKGLENKNLELIWLDFDDFNKGLYQEPARAKKPSNSKSAIELTHPRHDEELEEPCPSLQAVEMGSKCELHTSSQLWFEDEWNDGETCREQCNFMATGPGCCEARPRDRNNKETDAGTATNSFCIFLLNGNITTGFDDSKATLCTTGDVPCPSLQAVTIGTGRCVDGSEQWWEDEWREGEACREKCNQLAKAMGRGCCEARPRDPPNAGSASKSFCHFYPLIETLANEDPDSKATICDGCTVDGDVGNGTIQGNCDDGKLCDADGTCKDGPTTTTHEPPISSTAAATDTDTTTDSDTDNPSKVTSMTLSVSDSSLVEDTTNIDVKESTGQDSLTSDHVTFSTTRIENYTATKNHGSEKDMVTPLARFSLSAAALAVYWFFQ